MTKRIVDDLALFGGPPALTEPLHVGRPNIGSRAAFDARVDGIFERRWLTNHGPLVLELEQRIADFVGVPYCIATCNATVALEIAIRAAGLTEEVLVPAFTFVATAHALEWLGLTPIFCDVDPRTHNIDPADAERRITDRTSGLIGVHVWGRPCPVEALDALARRRRLTLLYDAAHAFACTVNGRMIGRYGLAEVFSFHATKFFNTFEGGAIVTSDRDFAARARLMSNFGFTGYDQVDEVGTNGKMTEVAAAMGLTSFDALDGFVEVNHRNYNAYRARLAPLPGLHLAAYDDRERCNYQYVVVEVDAARTGISRDVLYRALWAENVRARRYFHPACHRMAPYRTRGLDRLPETERLTGRVLSLPTGTAVSEAEIAQVAGLLEFLLAHGPEIEARAAHLTCEEAAP
jgi:dTDP-4-amino-4,6-dideoxygalactose transaminase